MASFLPDFGRIISNITSRPGRPAAAEGESMVVTGGGMSSMGGPTIDAHYQILSTDEILKQKGYTEYKQVSQDATVKAAMRFKKVLAVGRVYDVAPHDDSEQAEEIAQFVKYNLDRIDFRQVMRRILSACDYGFSLSEIVWERGTWDGKDCILLCKVATRDPQFIEIFVDKNGNPSRFEQRTPDGRVIPLRPDKVVHFAYGTDFGEPYGYADTRSIYKNWWAKKYVQNFWNVYMERMGAPLTLMHYPQGATDDLKNTLRRILGGLSSKTEILVPEGVDLKLVEAQRAGSAGFEKALDYHDNEIMRGILVPAMIGAGNSTKQGSDSQSRLHLKMLFKVGEDLARDMMFVVQRQLVKRLVELNFDIPEEEIPKVILQDYGEFEAFEISDAIRQLFNVGMLDVDQEDINYVRGILGLPLRDEDNEDEVQRPLPAPQGGGPGSAPPNPGQGNENAAKGGSERKTDPNTGNSR